MGIECVSVRCFAFTPSNASALLTLPQSQLSASNLKKNKNGGFKIKIKITAKLNFHQDNDDPYLQAAISRASFRFQESLRPEPLFIDPYAACFISPDRQSDIEDEHKMRHYCICTRFIDDKLLTATKNIDGVKQVVLFTDGMDARAYRFSWPNSTIIYDVSPQRVFETASQKLQDVGAKIPRSCLLRHVPMESSDLQQVLRDKGFDGSRPSVWMFQGLPAINLASFKDILFMVSSLAMKGCLFLGEFPLWLTETQMGFKPSVEKWMDELFMSHGFQVQVIGYNDVARNLGQEPVLDDNNNLLFVAEHLRFSDDQMETWRREFQRFEEGGDEEGFEEL